MRKILTGVFLFGLLVSAQEVESESALAGPNEKAARYHKLLLKRPGNPTVFSRFVDAWLDTGDKKAMHAWLEGSAKDGGAPEWRVLAAFHEYLGEDEAALNSFHKAVTLDEKDASLRLARAKLHAKLLSFEAALDDLKVATADEKLGVEASKLTGIYLARAGRVEEAVAAWKKVIERFPKDEELREDLIEVEVAEGLYDDAIAASQALVGMTKDPYKKALRQLRLGDIQVLGNQREEGLKTYEVIMAATGADTWLEREVLAQVERVFMREDDIQGLRDFFQKLREAHPRRISVRKALASQMALNGEMNEAVALFREVIKITPGDVGNREEFIGFLEVNERWKEAREELAELLKLREGDALLWERMAQIEGKGKSPEGVKAALAKVRDLKKGTPEGLIAVAALYTQAELPTEAEALLREGRGSFGESDEMTEALASFLMANVKEAEALAIWAEMAKSADREGLLRVARSLTGHGKSAEAFQLLQGRMEEFGKDPLILGQFCALALSEEEAVVAMPYGLEMVRQAASPTELEGAIKTASRVAKRSGMQEEVLKQLEGKEGASIGEQCFITELYAEQGDTRKALEILTAAEKADEGLLARFYRVRFEENRGETEKAIASLRAIIALPRGAKTVHVRRLVGLLESAGDLPGALKAVGDWKRMAPGDQAAWTRRAELLTSHGEPDQAVLELRRMIGKFGAEEDSRAKLAAALIEANEHHSAERIYEQLYEEGEDLATKLKWVGELAKIAKKEGTLDDLLADFARRKRSNAHSVAPLLALAEIHHSLGQYEERRSALLEASRRRPNDIKLLQHIAEVEVRAGEFDRAVGLLKDAAKRDASTGSKEKLVALYLKNGEFQEGLRLLKQIPSQAEDPRKIEAVALSLMTMMEWDLAVRHLSEFLLKHPDDWRLKYLYAVALEMDGSEEEAFSVYQSLLEVDQKMKGLKVLFDPKTYRQGYYLRRAKSGEAMAGWMKLGVMSNFVENEVRNLARLNGRFGSSSRSNLVSLPGDAEEVRMLSFLKAVKLVSKFEEEKREGLLQSLVIKGVERLDLYRASRGERAEYFTKIDELLKAEPGDPKLLQLWVENRNSAGKDYQDDPERLGLLLKRATEKNPVNGFTLISGMLARDEMPREEALAKITSLLASTPKGEERESLMQSLLYFVERRLRKPDGHELDGLGQAIIAEAVAREKKPKNLYGMNRSLLMAMTLGEQDAAVVLLNRISGWLTDDQQRGGLGANYYRHHNSSWGSHGRGGGSGTLAVPVFPPSQVEGLPNPLSGPLANAFKEGAAALSKDAERRAQLIAQLKEVEKETAKDAQAEVRVLPEPLEVFRGRVAEIDSPILRALVGAALDDVHALPDFVKSVAESTDFDELQLAAGFLWKQKKLGESYQILTRMRMLTLSRVQRKEVDGKLAWVGSLLADQKDLEWDREPARRAALRLRKSLTNQADRTLLVKVLVKLGLQKEADKIGKALVKKSSSSFTNRSSRKTGLPLVMSLMVDGRKEEASRVAAKLIKSYQRNQNSSYNLKNLTDSLAKLELVEATLERIHPGESESISRRLAYANLALSVEKKELARPIFASLVKDRPDMTAARIGLFMSLPEDERSLGSLLGKDLTKIDYDALLTAMGALWESADNRFNETLAALELTHEILTGIPPDPDPKRNLSWVSYHVLSGTSDTYFNHISIGALYQSRENRTFDKEKTDLFEVAAKKVFLAMLKHPQTAEQGFMLLAKAQGNLKIEDDELLGYAQDAVAEVVRRQELTMMNQRGGSQMLWAVYNSGGSSRSGSLTDVLDPMSYLITKGGNEASLGDELLPLLKESQPEKFAQLSLARQIGKATPEEAERLFREWYAKLEEGKGNEKKTPVQISAALVDLTSHLLMIDLKPSSFTDELEDRLIQIKTTDWSDPSGWTGLSRKWLGWIALHKDKAAIRVFLMKLSEAALGPKKQWPVLAKLGYQHQPQHYQSNGYALGQRLSSYLTIEKAVMPVLELSLEGEFQQVIRNFNVQGGISQVMQGFDDAENFVEWLVQAEVLSESPKSEKRARKVLGFLGLIDSFPHKGSDYGEKMVKALEPLKLDPLLKNLVMTRYLPPAEQGKRLVAAWEERTELLEELLGKNETVVMAKLAQWFPKFEAPDEAPKLQALLKSLRLKEHEEVRKKAEKWLQDGIEIDPNDYEGRKLWAEVSKVVELDPILAAKIALKAIENAETKQNPARYGSSNRSVFDEWSGRFLETLVQGSNRESLVHTVRVMNFMYRSETGKRMGGMHLAGNNYSYYLRGQIRTSTQSFPVPKESERKQIELAFASWAKELNPEEEALFASLVIPGFLEYWNFKADDLPKITKWADEELRKESEIMAEALIIVMQQGGARRGSSKKRPALETRARASMEKLLPLLDLPSPLAVDFAFSLINSSNSQSLFAGTTQWEWLAEVLVDDGGGVREITNSQTLGILPVLARLEFPEKASAAKTLMDAIDGTLITQELLLKWRNNSQTWVRSLLPLALQAEDLPLAKRLIQQNSSSFRGDLALMLDVAGAIDAKTAAKLAPATTESYRLVNLPTFTKETPVAVAKVLEALSPRDRYRFEVMVGSLQDTKEKEQKTEVLRSARLLSLAERFVKEAPTDNGPRWQLLNIFGGDKKLQTLLKDSFAKDAKKTALSIALSLSDEGDRRADGQALLEIIEVWLSNELEAGNIELLQREIKTLVKRASEDGSYSARNMGQSLTWKLARHLLTESIEQPESAPAMAAHSRVNLENRLSLARGRYYDEEKGHVWLDLFLHTLAGETKAWYERATKDSENKARAYEGPLGKVDRGGIRSMTHVSGLSDESRSSDRVALVRTALSDPIFVEKSKPNLSNFLDAKLITQDELFKVIGTLPDDYLHKPKLLMNQARVIEARAKNTKWAGKTYERARKLALSQENLKIAHLCDALHARLLGQKKRISESWEYGIRVDPALLSEYDRKWFLEGAEVWREKASKKKPEQPKAPAQK